jgi:protein associated with RNAse G/E
MMSDQQVKVISRKYDLSIRRTWNCLLVNQENNLIELIGKFDTEVEHPDLGLIEAGTISHEYFWLDRCYNVFRFERADGCLRNFYCNINVPPEFDGHRLDYVDLDIDLIVWPDGRIVTLDEDEFEENAEKFGYSIQIRESTFKALDELLQLIARSEIPFDSL